MSINEISGYVDAAFEQHYRCTPMEPSSLEYAMMKESDYHWEREGELATYAIASAAEVEEEVAEDMRRVLEDLHCDIEMAQMGEEARFGAECCYEEKEPDDIEYREKWSNFEANLKSEARFFGTAAEATLDEIFQGLDGHRSPGGNPVIVEGGPGKEIASLYRARVFQGSAMLDEALKRPDLHLGPPPPAEARAGRMNAHGIGVFYGATDPRVATSEVRPPVGSRVVVGEFEIVRKVLLLDVNALRSVFIQGSVFDSEYIYRLERARFLERLRERFVRPVMPNDEPLEYLATQVVADYLASRSTPVLDGILYPSAQGNAEESNMVLFRKASRVAIFGLPDGIEIDASSGYHTEDGWETDYHVWERVARSDFALEEEQTKNGLADRRVSTLRRSVSAEDDDLREITLRVKPDRVAVHHVKAARYDVDVHRVYRYRSEQ